MDRPNPIAGNRLQSQAKGSGAHDPRKRPKKLAPMKAGKGRSRSIIRLTLFITTREDWQCCKLDRIEPLQQNSFCGSQLDKISAKAKTADP